MAGILAHYLVLEHLTSMDGVHAAAWCDNTPTVSWTNKLSSSKSMVAARLTRALATWLMVNKASPLVSWSIAGVLNKMADMASRTFHRFSVHGTTFAIDDCEFLHTFNTRFPHPQADSWHLFHFSNRLSMLIFSELLATTSTLGSWLRITTKGSAIGTIGPLSSDRSLTWTPCSPMCTMSAALPFSGLSLDGSGKVTTPEIVGSSGAKPSKSRYEPSARHSNWTDNPTQRTGLKDDTGFQSNVS